MNPNMKGCLRLVLVLHTTPKECKVGMRFLAKALAGQPSPVRPSQCHAWRPSGLNARLISKVVSVPRFCMHLSEGRYRGRAEEVRGNTKHSCCPDFRSRAAPFAQVIGDVSLGLGQQQTTSISGFLGWVLLTDFKNRGAPANKLSLEVGGNW